MAVELPRCATCRIMIRPGQNVIFRIDGRVQHVECPEVLCPVCARLVLPGDPIRRDGDRLLHGNCWMKRLRGTDGRGGVAQPISGGSSRSPWGLVPEAAGRAGRSPDEMLWLTRQLRQRARDARAEARALRQHAGA